MEKVRSFCPVKRLLTSPPSSSCEVLQVMLGPVAAVLFETLVLAAQCVSFVQGLQEEQCV